MQKRTRFGFVVGPSGVGKGYGVGNVLQEYTNTAIFVTGEWCRENVADLASRGIIVNDNLITEAGIAEYAHQQKRHGDKPFSFLIDAPRTIAQAIAFCDQFKRWGVQDLSEILVLHIHSKPITCLNRIVDRAIRQDREDDAKPEVVRRRLGFYYGNESPLWTPENPEYLETGGILHEVIPWLQEHTDYHHIDGDKELEDIRDEVQRLAPTLFSGAVSVETHLKAA